MSAEIRIGFTPQSDAVIAAHAQRPRLLLEKLGGALAQGLAETETLLKVRYLTGGDPKSPRRGRAPLAVRSGTLVQAATHEKDRPLSGIVGIAKGPASAYAATVAGPGTKTITPKKAKHLWIPVGDNLTPSGQTRISPRAAFEKRGPRGGRLLSIFTSRAGNLVAVLRSATASKRKGARRKTSGGAGGAGGGKLLFVLKKSVTVKGTDAVGRAVEDSRPRMLELLGVAVKSLDTSAGGGSGSGGGGAS